MASDPSISQFRSSGGSSADHAGVTESPNIDSVGDLYAGSGPDARDALNEWPAKLSDVAAAGERFALRSRQTLDHGVRKQPVEALLLAGAIGYLVGWAANRG